MLLELDNNVQRCCKSIPQRYVVALMCFFGLLNLFSLRGCLSIAITEMVEPKSKEPEVKPKLMDVTCTYDGVNSSTNNIHKTVYNRKNGETYDWDEYTQGLILSSFYWGYVITHILGAMLTEKFGGKYTLGIGVLLTAIFTVLTPTAIYIGNSTALIILRGLMGLFEGITFPAINALLAQWTPPEERSRTASFVFAGSSVGTVFTSTVSGWILQNSTLGWPSVFYIMGIIGILWFIVWVFTCYNNPRNHPYITQKEVDYLKERMIEHTHEKPPSVPWMQMLQSKPLWALAIAKIGFGWSSFTMMTDLPKYLSGVLKLSVVINGYITSLVFLCMWLGSIMSSWLADYLITKNHMSTTAVRKTGSVLALTISSCFVVAVSYAGCDRVLAIVLLIVAMTLLGINFPCFMANPLDLSPNYAGNIAALTSGTSALTGIATPYIIGVLTPNQSFTEWRLVFWILFGVTVFCNIGFLLFGSGEVEKWNNPEFLKQESNQKKAKITN